MHFDTGSRREIMDSESTDQVWVVHGPLRGTAELDLSASDEGHAACA